MTEKPMARPRRRLRRLALLPVIGGLALALGMPVSAQAGGTAGSGGSEDPTFTCRASALRVDTASTGPIEPFVASRDSATCRTEDASLIGGAQLPGGLGQASAVIARTTVSDDSSSAEAGVLDAMLNLPAPVGTVGAEVLTSEATASCNDGVASFTGSSNIAQITIGDSVIEPIPGQPQTIEIVPGGEILVVTFADQERTAEQITQRALVIQAFLGETQLLEVVVGEAIADVHGCKADKPKPPKGEKPPKSDKKKCNAGRGNGSEFGEDGKDCDPGNSGEKNQGGD